MDRRNGLRVNLFGLRARNECFVWFQGTRDFEDMKAWVTDAHWNNELENPDIIRDLSILLVTQLL